MQGTLERSSIYKTNLDNFFENDLAPRIAGVTAWQDKLWIATDTYGEKCSTDEQFREDGFGDRVDRFHHDPTRQYDNDYMTAIRLITTLGLPDTPQVRAEVRLLCVQVDGMVRNGASREDLRATWARAVKRIEDELTPAA